MAELANHLAKKRPELAGVCDLTSLEERNRLLPLVEVADVWGVGRASSLIQETVGHITAQRDEAAIASYRDLVDGLTRRAELAQDR